MHLGAMVASLEKGVGGLPLSQTVEKLSQDIVAPSISYLSVRHSFETLLSHRRS